jgi:hypothetical protein
MTQHPPARLSEPAAAATTPKKILLVDDEAIMLDPDHLLALIERTVIEDTSSPETSFDPNLPG